MNVALLLSGGCGKRFGSKIPKQYLDLCGKPVIQYTIDAVLASKKVDELVVVIDKEYIKYVDSHGKKIHFTNNGKERLNSVKNGLDYIKKNLDCDKLIIVQAVSPLITSKIIDDYIMALDEYDVVTTAEKCPGELFNKEKYEILNRNNFYFCQSPEAFRFLELYKYIDVDSDISELIYHYPNQPKICFYTDFEHNVKLTYKSDLDYCKFLMSLKKDEKL